MQEKSKHPAIKLWDSVELFLTGLFATAGLACAFFQVVARYFVGHAPEWAEEVVMYLVIWSVFIIASKLVRSDEHVAADIVVSRIPDRWQHKIKIAILVMMLIFAAVICYYGFIVTYEAWSIDERSTTSVRFPMWLCYLAVPVGLLLVSFSCVYKLYRVIFHYEDEKHEAHFHEMPDLDDLTRKDGKEGDEL